MALCRTIIRLFICHALYISNKSACIHGKVPYNSTHYCFRKGCVSTRHTHNSCDSFGTFYGAFDVILHCMFNPYYIINTVIVVTGSFTLLPWSIFKNDHITWFLCCAIYFAKWNTAMRSVLFTHPIRKVWLKRKMFPLCHLPYH